MTNDFFDTLLEEFNLEGRDIGQFSPLVLAYIGDAVYEVYIRTLLVTKGNANVHKLHIRSISYVKAKAQSDAVHDIMEKLTPEEQDIVRRGRNAKSGTMPKNAEISDYKYATGFESLIGYLYLNKEYDRLKLIIDMATASNKKQ